MFSFKYRDDLTLIRFEGDEGSCLPSCSFARSSSVEKGDQELSLFMTIEVQAHDEEDT